LKHDIKVFTVDAKAASGSMEVYSIGDFFGPADLGLYLSQKNNSLNIGTGLFADSVLSGSNRLIFSGYSPAWDGFYISAMGGAGYVFENLDISMLSITNKAQRPSLLYLNHKGDGKIQMRLEAIDIETIWASKEFSEDGGMYALMHYLAPKYAEYYEKEYRILAVGPSAKTTDCGAICSVPIKKSKASNVDTWAGRGGFGSKLFQDHGIVAIVYGGTPVERGFRDRERVDGWFEQKYQMSFKQKDKEVTSKYHYVDILKTGGTLGVNYASLGGDLFSYNYKSIHKTEEERRSLDERFIKNNYLQQFNEETIATKNQENCGEPCAVMCKKMNGKYKKDYEPYQAMGPLLGIFDQRAAEKLNRYSDAYGFDAISIGGVLSWLVECLSCGYLTPQELGLHSLPHFEERDFDVVVSSMRNADIAIALLDAIIEKRALVDLSQGARVLAHRLAEQKKNPKILDTFCFNANGEKGWMVPNQYWTPGVLSPMPLMGKYYMYYGGDFVPPRALGHKNAQRFVAELMIDNIGVCRFHRGWAEEMAPEIIGHLYGLEKEFIASIHALALKINDQSKPIFWETQKNSDIVHMFLKKKESITYAQELKYWQNLFDQDSSVAARQFWEEIHAGVQEAFAKLSRKEV